MLVTLPERGPRAVAPPRRSCPLCGAPLVARADDGCTAGRCASDTVDGPDAGEVAFYRERLKVFLFETEIALAALEAVIAVARDRRRQVGSCQVGSYLERKILLMGRRAVLRTCVEAHHA